MGVDLVMITRAFGLHATTACGIDADAIAAFRSPPAPR
jgi:hypothetical protein